MDSVTSSQRLWDINCGDGCSDLLDLVLEFPLVVGSSCDGCRRLGTKVVLVERRLLRCECEF